MRYAWGKVDWDLVWCWVVTGSSRGWAMAILAVVVVIVSAVVVVVLVVLVVMV